MNEVDALELIQAAIWTVIVASGPVIGSTMIVGVGIGLLQALTQVQEITLTFVPKIVVVLVVIIFSAPFIGSQMQTLTQLTYGRIETGFN
ncbi:MAG: flagellar biosynthetic protein FliQ [Anderseniella sp.]